MSVEISLLLQIDDIAATKQAFATAVAARDLNTLWWLVDYAGNIIYENRVKGGNITGIDTTIASINIGSSVFGEWFNLQNSYFSQDIPIVGVSSLKSAIETYYRWRVPQYFNDIALTGNNQAMDPVYVFPYPDFFVGAYAATGGTTGTYTKGNGPLDLTVVGPGILSLTSPDNPIGAANLGLTLTCVYSDGTAANLTASVPSGTAAGVPVAVGGQALTAVHTGATGNGVISVAANAQFKVGTLVLLRENKTGTTPFLWETEIAEVVAIGAGSLTLRQPTPVGATVPFPNGLRNNYTTAALVYPLFTDVTAVTNTTGTAGDDVTIGFLPDRPQGFVNTSTISQPQ